jgi:hypothetical protein
MAGDSQLSIRRKMLHKPEHHGALELATWRFEVASTDEYCDQQNDRQNTDNTGGANFDKRQFD